MKILGIAALALTTALVTPAAAQTYDAFSSFNGTQGAGNFYYGEINPATPNASGTFFTANTNCFIDGSVCLQQAPNHDVPGFTKGGTPGFQYGSVNVPQDRLLGHPDDDSDLTVIAFVNPNGAAGKYRVYGTFNVQDINPSGVDISLIQTTSGGLPFIITPLSSIGANNPTYSFYGIFTLGDSEMIGFGLGNGGFYGNDSTGINFQVVAGVPEPATWAMMIGGFGLVGGAMRRRKATTVRYA